MTENDKISVIIPVYNVERYLDSCLKSVTGQTYGNVEIILVNDGSTDNSGAMCDAWARKDCRIKVVHKKNEGLNYARKSGHEVATGSYVMFLDSDDLIHSNTLENTLTVLRDEHLDMVAYMYAEFSDENTRDNDLSANLTLEYDIKKSTKEVFRFLISNGYENIYPMTAWGKLYKKEHVDNVDWSASNLRAFEDNFFTPQLFSQIQSFAVLKQQLYFYRRNDQGVVLSKMLTGNHLNGKSVGYLEYMNLLKEYWTGFLKKYDIENDLNVEMREFWLTNMQFRLKNLLDANLVCEENNTSYIDEILNNVHRKYKLEIQSYQSTISEQSKIIQDLESLNTTINKLESELTELKTVRGSMRNAARQAKRVIKQKAATK